MTRRGFALLVVAGATLAAGVAAVAASIAGIAPGDVSVGTPFVLTGSGFGTKKPALSIVLGKFKAAAKVVGPFTDGQIQASLTSAAHTGTYDVVVRPAGKGMAPVTLVGGLTIDGPEISSSAPPNPAGGGTLTITGTSFGTKKGSVKIGKTATKVISWVDQQIVVKLAKKPPTGVQDLVVKNSVASTTKTAAVDVGGTNTPPVNEIAVFHPSEQPNAGPLWGNRIALGTDYVAANRPNRSTSGNVNHQGQWGGAYVYTLVGGVYAIDNIVTRTNGNEDASDFTSAIAFAGNTLLAADDGFSADAGKFGEGTVYVFHRGGSVWTNDQQLVSDNPVTAGVFGAALAGQADRLVVGEPRAVTGAVTTGAVHVYTRTAELSPWTLDQRLAPAANVGLFGLTVALDGDTIVVGAVAQGDGAATGKTAEVWVRGASTWSQQAVLSIKNGAGNEEFGESVAVSGDTALIGATGESSGRGGAYVFVRSGATWTQQAHLVPSSATTGDAVGWKVALLGDTAVVATRSSGDRVYVFRRTGTTWAQSPSLSPSDGANGEEFGQSIATDATRIFVSAPFGPNQGEVYVFPEH